MQAIGGDQGGYAQNSAFIPQQLYVLYGTRTDFVPAATAAEHKIFHTNKGPVSI